MFCVNCGCKLTQDALFCHKCGTKVNDYSRSAPVQKSETTDLNRNALRIYLQDVLSLECIKRKYQIELKKLDKSLSLPKSVIKECPIDIFGTGTKSRPIHLAYGGKKYYIAVYDNYPFYNGLVDTDSFLNPSVFRWLEIDENIKYLKSESAWQDYGTGYFSNKRYKKNAANEFLRAYSEFKKTAPAEFVERTQYREGIVSRKHGIASELSKLEELLKKAYNRNIIPGVFRNNLYAVFYLHDFISTSNESFATALLHYDLNEIKAKLDTVISQQQEIIIRQSIMVAQNKQLLQQNKNQLHKLSQIEDNTYRAAQYAEIAANNAEACAWISMANYLK